ncbi:LysR family transcriptional regulator [Streptomyces sp. NPDC052773]|jgi:DNA-binding transcriptional LysR family regulator|uniref:LysR family transcriptional regulator n=1 Tax=Streptomyces sp. NPDC052773 TaxID=3365693 RepID=UPI0037D26421
MLNLDRLRTLDALARHGSVSGAAEGLHITTSAVSQQLAKLEREVGQRLLAKHGRGVRLTDAGRLLAEHAARILSQVAIAQSDLEAQRGQVAGELRLSAFPTAARGLFPTALAALRAEHPALRLRSCELEPERGIRAVVRGDLDLAVVLDWYNKPMPLPDGLVKASILDDPADVAMPVGHPLAGRDEVDLTEFAEDEWITWGEGEFCHEWLMFTLRSRGIEPILGHRAAETHTQLGLVAAGLGVCVVPLLGRHPMPPGVVAVPLKQRVRRHVYVVWRADADRRPSIRAAVRALRAAGERITGRPEASAAPPASGSPTT